MALLVFGSLAVAVMLLMYALEARSPRYVLGFAFASAAAAAYGFATEAWPFAVIETIWSLVALQRWRQVLRPAAIGPSLRGETNRSDDMPETPEPANDGGANAAFACNMDAFTSEQRERHMALIEQHLLAADEAKELPGGYELRYDNGSHRYADLAEWISLERLCCPWIQFGLEIEGETVKLSLLAPQAARPVLAEEFAPLLTALRS